MDDNLVKTHPRDVVLIKAQGFREKQKADRAKQRQADIEKTTKIKEAEKAEELALKRHWMKLNYEDIFRILAGKYLKIKGLYLRDYLESLSDDQVGELEKYIYERARKFLWLKTLLPILIGLAIPAFGWSYIMDAFQKNLNHLPYYKFVSLRDWYRKEFGQINFGQHTAARGEVVTPSLRD